jgi:hypothetical protein
MHHRTCLNTKASMKQPAAIAQLVGHWPLEYEVEDSTAPSQQETGQAESNI